MDILAQENFFDHSDFKPYGPKWLFWYQYSPSEYPPWNLLTCYFWKTKFRFWLTSSKDNQPILHFKEFPYFRLDSQCSSGHFRYQFFSYKNLDLHHIQCKKVRKTSKTTLINNRNHISITQKIVTAKKTQRKVMKKYTLIFIYVCILILVVFELIQWIFWPKKFFLNILISNHTDPNDSSDINIPPLSTHHEIY